MSTLEKYKPANGIDARITPFIERVMRQKQITGLSIALVDESEIVFAKGFGFADKDANRGGNTHTVYRIGSITKVFTATAAMQLCEHGLLDIDRPVLEYIPEFSIRGPQGDLSQITPRTIMTHHSGLPADWYTDYWSKDPRDFRKVLEYLHKSHLTFPPNKVFSYSNLGMSLLGLIIERISGLSYHEYIEQNILTPLGMAETKTTVDEVQLSSLSKAYARGKEVGEPTLRDAPAGTILSNVEDMSHFIAMILGGGTYQGVTLLQPDSLAEMFRPQNEMVRYDLGFRIGLNWILNRPQLASAGKVCWHDGGSPHFYSMLIVMPEAKLGTIVLTNSDGGMGMASRIADEILKEALEIKTGKSAGKVIAIATPPPSDKNNVPDSPEGTFASVAGIVEIKQHGSALRVTMKGQQLALVPTGDGWYKLKLLLFGILPLKMAALENLRLSVRSIDGVRILGFEQEGLQTPIGFEYHPVPIPEAWRRALGEYQLLDQGELPPFTSLHLQVTQGRLEMVTKARKVGKLSFVLQPISDTESKILGLGRFGGEIVEWVENSDKKKLKLLGLDLEKSA